MIRKNVRQVLSIRVWVFFALGLLMSAGLCRYLHNILEANLKAEFQSSFEKSEGLIQDSIRDLQSELESVRGAYVASDYALSADGFQRYAQSRNNFVQSDEALGFGFIRRVAPEERDAYLREQAAKNPLFRHQDHKYSHKDQHSYIVEAFQPLNGRMNPLGYDFSSEPRRYQAANQAMISGESVITHRLTLMNYSHEEPAFIMLLPIYKDPMVPATITQRRRDLLGWAHAPILLSDLLSRMSSRIDGRLEFNLYDEVQPGVYESLKGERWEDIKQFDHQDAIWVAGRRWHLQMRPKGLSLLQGDDLFPWVIFGLLVMINGAGLFLYYGLEERRRNAVDDTRSLVNTVPVSIGYWDVNFENVWSSPAYATAFGTDPKSLKGRNLFDFVPPEEADETREILKLVAQGQAQRLDKSYSGMRDGVYVSRSIYIEMLKDERGGIHHGYYFVMTDITALKQAESEREFVQARMAQSAKLASLGEVAGGVAHEINNPLAIIRLKVDQAKGELQLPEINIERFNMHLTKIETTVDRISTIVRGLRNFSRSAESDPMQPCEVNAVVNDSLALCRERFKHLGVEIRWAPTEDFSFAGRSTQISQVLVNLFSNAYDASKASAEPWVEVTARRMDNGMLEIAVTDSGPGVDPAVVDKIMQPFFTTKPVGVGTGLGLSISTGIVAAHGGQLTLDRRPGPTRFVFTLPELDGPQLQLPAAI